MISRDDYVLDYYGWAETSTLMNLVKFAKIMHNIVRYEIRTTYTAKKKITLHLTQHINQNQFYEIN